MRAERKSVYVFAIAFLAASYPALLALFGMGIRGAFTFFAADAFYYLSVARHSIHMPFYTFDGIYPTNGFHPMWQYYLTTGFNLFGLDGNQGHQVLFSFLSGVLFTALGTGLFAVCLRRLTGSSVLAILGSVPGPYYLVFSVVNSNYGSMWSFMNGMETPLSILFFGVLMYLLVCREVLRRVSYADVILLSAVLTLMLLSRLDDVFMFVPFLIFLLARSTDAQRWKKAVCGAIVPALALGAYLAYNLHSVGTALPISSLTKGGIAIARNLSALAVTLMPYQQFADSQTPGGLWQASAWRTLQMTAPGLLAAAMLYALAYRRDLFKEHRTVIGILAGYAVIKSLYNLTNVQIMHQGHWYFPLCIMVFNMIVVLLAGQVLRKVDLHSILKSGEAVVTVPHVRITLGLIGMALLAMGISYLRTASSSNAVVGHYSLARLALSGSLLLVGVATLLSGIVYAARVDSILKRLAGSYSGLRSVAHISVLLIIVVSANALINYKAASGYNSRFFDFWESRDKIARDLESVYRSKGIIEFDDGVISYSLSAPAMNGFGLTLDKEAFEEKNKGKLLDIAYRRGFRAFTSLYYFTLPKGADADPVALRKALSSAFFLDGEDLDQWDFRVLYTDGDTGVSFIGFAPRAGS